MLLTAIHQVTNVKSARVLKSFCIIPTCMLDTRYDYLSQTRYPSQILSVCPLQNYYYFFHALLGILLKGMVGSCLLSKDALLVPDIDGVMALWIFKRRAQNTQIDKIWLLNSTGGIYSWPPEERFWYIKPHQPNKLETDAFGWPTPIKIGSRVVEKELPQFGTAHFPVKSGPMHFGSRVWS